MVENVGVSVVDVELVEMVEGGREIMEKKVLEMAAGLSLWIYLNRWRWWRNGDFGRTYWRRWNCWRC